jgi:predicted nucleic acid-binding Zn ribbon protein
MQLGFTDDPPSTCPDCGSDEVRKVFSPVGISFKGSGFYKTDSRSGSSTSSSSSSSGSTTPSTGSSSGSSSHRCTTTPPTALGPPPPPRSRS